MIQRRQKFSNIAVMKKFGTLSHFAGQRTQPTNQIKINAPRIVQVRVCGPRSREVSQVKGFTSSHSVASRCLEALVPCARFRQPSRHRCRNRDSSRSRQSRLNTYAAISRQNMDQENVTKQLAQNMAP